MGPDDVRRIAFVTRRFRDLQGGYRMWGGVYLIVGAWLTVRRAADEISWWSVAWFVWICVIPGFVDHTLKNHYAHRFGRASVGQPWGRISYYILVAIAVTYDVLPAHASMPALAPLIVAAAALRDTMRDWPWRAHRSIDVLACVTASLFWAQRIPDAPRLLGTAALICTGAVVTGYLDYRLLIRVLGFARRPNDDTEMVSAD